MFQYQPVQEEKEIEGGAYTTYGIRVLDYEQKELLAISDISLDEQRVVSLCQLCNQEKLDILHIMDVIEDFLCT